MEKVSEKDIIELTNNARLHLSDLENLFVVLGLEGNEIENPEKNADTKNSLVKERSSKFKCIDHVMLIICID